jgi:DNA primase
MPLFPPSFIDDLRLQANILTVVQEYVPLRRSGATYKGLCPFHGEKTPSFHVNPEKGFFHCFGCGVGGDVFKFLELHEKVGFQEAVRLLAQRFGLSLPEPVDGGGENGSGGPSAATREGLLKVHEVAAEHFREALAGPAGAAARQQLTERGILPDTVEELGIGYAPAGRDSLLVRLKRAGFSPALLAQSGLIVQRDGGSLVERFRHRLMIPICRDTGSVIAFGGRSLDGQGPKYLNSPETPIYSKGRTLYGLHLAKGQIRKLGYAVLVEGYFDFAQVLQAQAAPAIASCGTALTPQQARLLRRFTRKVVLCYDPDSAGQNATARSSELLVSEGFDVNVALLDTGQDPDTFIRRQGADSYRARLRASRPYLEYLLDRAAAGVDFTSDEGKRRFLNAMLEVAARIPEAPARDQFGDRIAFRAGITEDVVRAEIRKAAVNRKVTVMAREVPRHVAVTQFERALIWGLFHRPEEAIGVLAGLDVADFDHLSSRDMFEVARSLCGHPPKDVPHELGQRLSTSEKQLASEIAAEPAAPATRLADCARDLKLERYEREAAGIQREIDRLQRLGTDSQGEDIHRLFVQKSEMRRRIDGLKRDLA